MERMIVIIGMHNRFYRPDTETETFKIGPTALLDALNGGFVLDASIHNGSYTTETAVVYHLVRYSEEEKLQMLEQGEPRIVKVARETTVEGVNARLDEGYVIAQEWAKETLLHLHEKPEVKGA